MASDLYLASLQAQIRHWTRRHRRLVFWFSPDDLTAEIQYKYILKIERLIDELEAKYQERVS